MDWAAIYMTIFIIVVIGIIFIIVKIKEDYKSTTTITKKYYYETDTVIKEKTDDYAYKKTRLFSPGEKSFFRILQQALDNKVLIFGKIRVADILAPEKNIDHSTWQKAFNKISKKHFDFVLCTKDTLSVLCAIELNDKSHSYIKQKKRDEFIVNACESAGLPLIQITAKSNYVTEDIKKALNKYLDNTN